VSVYLSVSPPDGFTKWGEVEWDRWLKDHPWEAAERVCSAGDWAIFLYQVRAHTLQAKRLIEPHLEALVNQRPLDTRACQDLKAAVESAREELSKKPAEALLEKNNQFASVEDIQSMISAARQRKGSKPTAADVWGGIFDILGGLLLKAEAEKRGIYFGNV
jgi:hypothetical protein